MVFPRAVADPAPVLVPVGEASQILHVHPNTLRKWSDLGLIPSYRIGQRRDRRFALNDLLAFLERTAHKPADESLPDENLDDREYGPGRAVQ